MPSPEFLRLLERVPVQSILFFPRQPDKLRAGEQVDRACWLKDMFSGRWPSYG